jgi:tetratricopeptide (TPR) repeat protein
MPNPQKEMGSKEAVGDAEFYFKQGIDYDREGQYDQAIEAYNKALEMNPIQSGAVYNARGMAYAAKGDYNQAIADYSKAIETDPENRGVQVGNSYFPGPHFTAYFSRGGAYAAKGEYDQAIADYSKVIEIDPNQVGVYYNRGNIYAAKGEYEKAVADYTKAIEIGPNFVEAYEKLALLYYQHGELEKAIAKYKTAVKIYSNLSEINKNQTALDIYNAGIAQASNNIAWFSAQIGQNLDEALQFAKKAVELAPIASHLDTLGYVYYKREEYQEAERERLRALELEPENKEYQKHLEEIRTAKTWGTSTLKSK